MRPLEPLCSFFFELAKALKAKSLAEYTYDTLDLVDFLEELDPPADLLSATEEDLIAYREDRTEHQDEPISAGTWQRRRALINNFYDWAMEEAKLLDIEVGEPRRDGLPRPVVLQATAKYSLRRTVEIQHETMLELAEVQGRFDALAAVAANLYAENLALKKKLGGRRRLAVIPAQDADSPAVRTDS
ncbi:site-specific integrase [Streptomyces sp. NPDC101234]|uniref:site-specific integrase n=1 Tax=Streptomyces sp. NPDC101234 TaxID=3366138 RepID=UPI0037FD6CD1